MDVHVNDRDLVKEAKLMVKVHGGLMLGICIGLPAATPNMACKSVKQPPYIPQVTAGQHGCSVKSVQVCYVPCILWDVLYSRAQVRR
jgi:hypothetical protein